MKTKQFIKEVEALGYSTTNNGYFLEFWVMHKSRASARVSIKGEALYLNTSYLSLIKLCMEYTETPIEEREEEKFYTVQIPDSPERTNVFALCKLVNGDVCINSTSQHNFKKHDRYRLTESEIKRSHEYLWQFAKEVE